MSEQTAKAELEDQISRAKCFALAFREAVQKCASVIGVDQFSIGDCRRINELMFGAGGKKNSVLERGIIEFAARIWDKSLEFHREWYTIDLVGVSLSTDVGRYHFIKKVCELLVEHENGFDLETEIWKLAHWRAKLKVAIFYDFPANEVERTKKFSEALLGPVSPSEWLSRKIENLANIINLNQDRLGVDEAEILLIVGQKNSDQTVNWRHFEWKSRSFEAFALA